MATKGFLKNFEDFKGEDNSASDLSRASNFASNFQNYEVTSRKSARGRVGHKQIGQVYSYTFPGTGQHNFYPKYLLAKHLFVDSNNVQQENLIGLGTRSWKLAPGIFRVVIPANGSFHFYPKDIGGGVYHYVADCRINNVSVGGTFPKDCGLGTERTGAGLINLYELSTAITALGGGWSCILTPSAIADGAQGPCGHAAPVTVKVGHTLAGGGRVNVDDAGGGWDILSTTANSLTLKFTAYPLTTFNVADLQPIGAGIAPAATLPFIDIHITTDVPFLFWEDVPGSFFINQNLKTAKNCADVLYFGSAHSLYTDVNNGNLKSGMYKYDGREMSLAGIPQAPLPTLAAPGGGASLGVGRYKYLIEYVHTDAQGNEVHGNASDLLGEAALTTVAANTNINITFANVVDNTSTTVPTFGIRSAIIDAGAHAANSHFHVAANTNQLRLGDWIYFKDALTGVLQNRQITGLTSTQVTFSGAAVATNGAGEYSLASNLLINVFRTKVGGTFYYYLTGWADDPTFGAAAQTHLDTVADTALGYVWEGPFMGTDRRDMPPACPFIEPHQGLLVGVGDFDFPQTVFWSNYDSPEYWSRSTNYQEMLSTETGRPTALASDQADILLVFKKRSHTIISGDLFSGGFSMATEAQGDVGCVAAESWTRIRGAIIFISNTGPRVVQGGELVSVDERLSPYFKKDQLIYTPESGLYERVASVTFGPAVNDDVNQKVYFNVFILNRAGTYYSRRFSFDYQKNTWSVYTLPIGGDGMAGSVMCSNSAYFLAGNAAIAAGSNVVKLTRALDFQNDTWRVYDSTDDLGRYAYADGLVPIPHLFRPQWEFLTEPSFDKSFLNLKLWSLNPYPIIAHTLNVKTYRNFTVVTPDTVATVDFTDPLTIDAVVPLTLNRAKAIQFSFENNTIFECPHITGYEVEVATPYQQEQLTGKDE